MILKERIETPPQYWNYEKRLELAIRLYNKGYYPLLKTGCIAVYGYQKDDRRMTFTEMNGYVMNQEEVA